MTSVPVNFIVPDREDLMLYPDLIERCSGPLTVNSMFASLLLSSRILHLMFMLRLMSSHDSPSRVVVPRRSSTPRRRPQCSPGRGVCAGALDRPSTYGRV